MSPDTVILEEQGLRDGLQTLTYAIATAQKRQWADQLVRAGLRRLQVTSFVHPRLVPQMADAEALLRDLPPYSDVIISALVLNTKGVERAVATGIRHLAISLSASDTHSRKNANSSLAEAKTAFREMVVLAKANQITIRGGIQCAFGCRYEGNISEALVYDLVQHHLDCGVQELALADSTGMGNPVQVKRMMREVLAMCNNIPVSLHLHNTENKGYANCIAAVEAGVRQFDTAFGGLGGCPFIKGATGNIATEDTAHLLQQMGFDTGVDWTVVAEVSREMERLLGKPLPGLLYRLAEDKDIAFT
jgi:hydroxymethylglutaryl-CoA lyase